MKKPFLKITQKTRLTSTIEYHADDRERLMMLLQIYTAFKYDMDLVIAIHNRNKK